MSNNYFVKYDYFNGNIVNEITELNKTKGPYNKEKVCKFIIDNCGRNITNLNFKMSKFKFPCVCYIKTLPSIIVKSKRKILCMNDNKYAYKNIDCSSIFNIVKRVKINNAVEYVEITEKEYHSIMSRIYDIINTPIDNSDHYERTNEYKSNKNSKESAKFRYDPIPGTNFKKYRKCHNERIINIGMRNYDNPNIYDTFDDYDYDIERNTKAYNIYHKRISCRSWKDMKIDKQWSKHIIAW